MAQLCARQEAVLYAGALTEAAWLYEQQIRVLDEHLLCWVTSFVSRVEKPDQTDFHKASGALTQELPKMDREVLAIPAMDLEPSRRV